MHRRTPLIADHGPGETLAWLKMECWQPTGSFKIRGIGNLCRKAHARGARRLVSSSGGNAGMAAAYAARELAMGIRVVVPETTAPFVRDRLASFGARVEVCGSVWDQADARAREYCEADDTAYVPPFDHPDIWAGHASVIRECATEIGPPDEVVVSVGGGGLMSGVLAGMHEVGWADVPLVAAETVGAASLAAAIEAGEVVEIAEITSIATTLGARRVAEAALNWTRNHRVLSHVVSDAEAVAACVEFANRHRVLVEPACGAALAAARDRSDPGRTLLVVVCGGSGVNLGQLDAWCRKFELDRKIGLE